MPFQSFIGRIPNNCLYCRDTDMWVRDDDGQVLIGATAFGLHRAGEVIAFTAKPNGAEILRGKGMATIECHKTVLAVHAPISFRLITGNEDAEARPSVIRGSPYDAGWMARGLPLAWANDSTCLCSAEEYKQHILSIDPEARFEP
ncbi:glycine cleavage system protein H [Propionivibrio dicarboxylicus]|uniref:Glycine cleavage system H protein n=1 Tax=Propionivibrio dicarboxylicus TaxID=83767 RepID=A0A1G8MN55_9RHOO|nr:glycine cleavage system protein H [Propionivibrio dicarboxylicus]SDI69448.1 glycine cleavage system H protein [Propionivibrio dicarboxylicus]